MYCMCAGHMSVCVCVCVCVRYVLLKERNMLLTVKHEAWRKGFIMPAPERLKKVHNIQCIMCVVMWTLSMYIILIFMISDTYLFHV